MITAVIPVKPLAEAKARLASVLAPADRARLARTMLADVLEALGRCPEIERRLVVSADPEVLELARGLGADALAEPRAEGLNAAIRAAAAELAARSAAGMLYVPGDVPFVTPADIAALAEAARAERHLVVAPAADGDGTNALLVSPPEVLEPSFGPGSAERHMHAGRAAGLNVRKVWAAGLALDIDTPEDLAELSTLR